MARELLFILRSLSFGNLGSGWFAADMDADGATNYACAQVVYRDVSVVTILVKAAKYVHISIDVGIGVHSCILYALQIPCHRYYVIG